MTNNAASVHLKYGCDPTSSHPVILAQALGVALPSHPLEPHPHHSHHRPDDKTQDTNHPTQQKSYPIIKPQKYNQNLL